MSGLPFEQAAEHLLDALGYRSDRTLPDQSGSPGDFISALPADNPGTKSERDFLDHAASVRLVFQVSDFEIRAAASSQGMLFEAGDFDKGHTRSFFFTAVELTGSGYSRTSYVAFTREINKRFLAPTVVLFRTADGRLSLAFAHRRKHKRNPGRDVLGKVSLVREIDPASPHRAHVGILADLRLADRVRWMEDRGRGRDFDGLLAAWLDTLDTQELNTRFFKELFAWFERAVKEAEFPTGEKVVLQPEEHVIRLITRLLFVWFMREKGLVASDLFVENRVRGLLRDYDSESGDSYYRAVLQNLFFATLNTDMDKRGFSKVSNTTHRDFSRYRFRKEMSDAGALLDLFGQTPFINGGLFDCLDSEEATGGGGYRIDCFSDVHYTKLSIPNRLFFDDDGLIDLFDRYKFTVEENTPAEQEVALDPELLGSVFENLLAAFNPETRETARKQTGSYYTPRPVVDYMVDEALVESLASKVQPTPRPTSVIPAPEPESIPGQHPDDDDQEFWRERLRYLLDYEDAFDDANKLFDEAETAGLVRAMSEIKVLDPAVGSGAFPMGVLHKLTLALGRLDPHNDRWQSLQEEKAGHRATAAFGTHDQRERDAELKEISDTFERYRDSDFGRKLYLVQNSIFGVDIQPVACQIAKLRFFISLAIEQEPDPAQPNSGIKPLPNLETRFVAANTLLGLGEPVQIPLGGQNRLAELNDKLRANRERHFHATTRSEKLKISREDKRLRRLLAQELVKAGMDKSNAAKVSRWDPYDQNDKADWFDSWYMFGVKATEGFDVVIGNPPYVQLQANGGELANLYRNNGYVTFTRTGDLYQLFYERGCQLLRPQQGILVYITSNSWLKAEYGKSTRHYFAQNHTPLLLLELGKDVFESAIVDSGVLMLRTGGAAQTFPAADMDRLGTTDVPPAPELWGQVRPEVDATWSVLSLIEHSILDKMWVKGTPLRDWDVNINRGITTGYNKAFIIDDATKQQLVDADPKSTQVIKPVLRGRDVQRYRAQWPDSWLINVPWHFPLHLDSSIKGVSEKAEGLFKKQFRAVYRHLLSHKAALAARNKSETGIRYEWYTLQCWAANYHDDFAKEKLIWMDLTEQGRFSYSNSEIFCANTAFIMTGSALKYLCAMLNSNLVMWYMGNTALNSGMGVTRWIPATVERIPIPKLSGVKQIPFVRLVDHILEAKSADPNADTEQLEREIDRLVYDLYGLTPAEVVAVEREQWPHH